MTALHSEKELIGQVMERLECLRGARPEVRQMVKRQLKVALLTSGELQAQRDKSTLAKIRRRERYHTDPEYRARVVAEASARVQLRRKDPVQRAKEAQQQRARRQRAKTLVLAAA